ncbi:hypothetical protein CCP4SC76_2370001 [Gammaproteobacteria bacterium]
MVTNTRIEGEMPDSPAYVRYAGDLGDLLAAENVSRLLATTLNDIGESPEALAVWDQCFAQVQTDFADLGDTSAPLPTARYFKVFQPREITGISGDIRRPSNATGYLIHFKPNVVTPANEPYWDTWKSYRVFRTYWKPNTALVDFAESGFRVAPGNGRYFIGTATGDGLSGNQEPDWDAAGSDPIIDNEITWVRSSAAADYPYWQPLSPIPSGGIIRYRNGMGTLYLQIAASANDIPDWNSVHQTTAIVYSYEDYWTPNTQFNFGKVIQPGNGVFYKCLQAGISGNACPQWPTPGDSAFDDGMVKWQRFAYTDIDIPSKTKTVAN